MNQRQIVYILLWLPVSFIAVIAITKLFAAIFTSSSVPMLGQGITFLSLVIAGTAVILNQTGTDQDRDEEPTEDTPVRTSNHNHEPTHLATILKQITPIQTLTLPTTLTLTPAVRT